MRDLEPKTRMRRVVGAALLTLGLMFTASWHALVAADEIEDLRGHVPTGDELREEIVDLAGDRTELLVARNGAERELQSTLAARRELADDQRRLAREIEEATAHLRDVAVRSFVDGGPTSNLGFFLAVTEAADLAWRQHLVRNHAGAAEVAIQRLRELEALASDDVRRSIEEASRLREEIRGLEGQLVTVEQRQVDAEEILPLADAWDRAVIAIEEGSFGIAPPDRWEALRFCESTHDYTAISPSGQYRGAYQFDVETWKTVGGTGDPATAPPEEQDARARELYARRGHQPWPKCGRYLAG